LFGSTYRFDSNEFEIVRIERDGVPQTGPIEVKDGEQIGGIRVVVQYRSHTGAIRGQVKLENGEPPASRIFVSLRPYDPATGSQPKNWALPAPEIDSRGRFYVQGLAAGTYEILANTQLPNNGTVTATAQVTVTDHTVTEITLTLKSGKP
jgi:hypothetical protein